MKPFWRYGKPGKEQLIVKAFEAVKDSISWDDEEGAKIAVHGWLMDKGYFNGSNKSKSKKFKDPSFFWSKKNYDKYVALLRALLQQEFYKEVEEEAQAIKDAMNAQMAEEIAAEREKCANAFPEYSIGAPIQITDTWQDEIAGSFMPWALVASLAYWGCVLVFGKDKKK